MASRMNLARGARAQETKRPPGALRTGAVTENLSGLSSLELVPVLRGHVVRDLERAVRAAVDRFLDAEHLAAAEARVHLALDGEVQRLDLAAAAGEQHAVLEAVLELRVKNRVLL